MKALFLEQLKRLTIVSIILLYPLFPSDNGSKPFVFAVATYFARPTSGTIENAIVIFTDVFGIYKNVQLMADTFAARGYLTVVPDLFNGDAIGVEEFLAQKVVLGDWLAKHTPSTVDPIAERVINHLRNTLKVKKIAGIGYCFGGKVG